mmetsp:Transcript_44342/g.109218  ORF Transcript_44342/g.109218 Transcript_44342/m.109218 type:complete len:446 (+) Transcript_44342:50-1387(+)
MRVCLFLCPIVRGASSVVAAEGGRDGLGEVLHAASRLVAASQVEDNHRLLTALEKVSAHKGEEEATTRTTTQHPLKYLQKGWKSIHYAAMNGDMKTFIELSTHTGEMEALTGDGWTPATIAAAFDQPNVLRVLHHTKVDVSKSDGNKRSPAVVAASSGALLSLLALENLGVDLNDSAKNGRNPATVAAANGHDELLPVFHTHGVDLHVADAAGFTPATAGAIGCSVSVLSYLYVEGADLEAIDGRGETPAVAAAHSGCVEALKFLREKKVSLTAPGKFRTPLTEAAMMSRVDVVRYLAEIGVDLNEEDREQTTAAVAAFIMGKVPVLLALKELGVDVCAADSRGRSGAVSVAAHSQVPEQVIPAVSEVCSMSEADGSGYTPTTAAVNASNLGALLALHRLGVNMTAVDGNGMTPMGLAEHRELWVMMETLTTLGVKPTHRVESEL